MTKSFTSFIMDQAVLTKLILLRRKLHQHPELSGEEKSTAKKIIEFLDPLHFDELIYPIGGEGIVFICNGHEDGPTTMIRCELDALPVLEENNFDYKSRIS